MYICKVTVTATMRSGLLIFQRAKLEVLPPVLKHEHPPRGANFSVSLLLRLAKAKWKSDVN